MNKLPAQYLLDTHAWVWLLEDDPRLSEQTFSLMEKAQRTAGLFVSSMSVWELGNLEQAGRIKLRQPIEKWLELSLAGGLQSIPISNEIALASSRLPGNIHRDPADRILAATARQESLTLLTRDKLLLQYAHQGHLVAQKI